MLELWFFECPVSVSRTVFAMDMSMEDGMLHDAGASVQRANTERPGMARSVSRNRYWVLINSGVLTVLSSVGGFLLRRRLSLVFSFPIPVGLAINKLASRI